MSVERDLPGLEEDQHAQLTTFARQQHRAFLQFLNHLQLTDDPALTTLICPSEQIQDKIDHFIHTVQICETREASALIYRALHAFFYKGLPTAPLTPLLFRFKLLVVLMRRNGGDKVAEYMQQSDIRRYLVSHS